MLTRRQRLAQWWEPWKVPFYLALVSLGCVVRGYSYLPVGSAPASLPPGLTLMNPPDKIWIWGILWIVVGVAGLVTCATQLHRFFLLGFVSTLVLAGFWTGFYVYGWIDEGGRGYLNAATYLTIVALLLAVIELLTDRRSRRG